jgi:hypothetical protein
VGGSRVEGKSRRDSINSSLVRCAAEKEQGACVLVVCAEKPVDV